MTRSGLTPQDWVKVVLVAGIGTILEWVSAQPPVPWWCRHLPRGRSTASWGGAAICSASGGAPSSGANQLSLLRVCWVEQRHTRRLYAAGSAHGGRRSHVLAHSATMRLRVPSAARQPWCVQFDFYTYAQLTTTLKKVFFPTNNDTAQSLAFWSVYAVGECPQRCAIANRGVRRTRWCHPDRWTAVLHSIYGMYACMPPTLRGLLSPSPTPSSSSSPPPPSPRTAGFIFRPLGALIFGHIGDTYGRIRSLTISIVCMRCPQSSSGACCRGGLAAVHAACSHPLLSFLSVLCRQ